MTYNIKLSIIGNSQCGKTTLLQCFVQDGIEMSYFDLNIVSTIGISFFTKTINLITHDQSCIVRANLKLYDTAGQERFRAVVKCVYRDAQGIILVFDLSNSESFFALDSWLADIQSVNPSEFLVVILVGTKSDLTNVVVTDELITTFCQKHKLSYIETSAKKNINVTCLFETLTKNIIAKMELPNYDLIKKSSTISLEATDHTYYKSCC